MVGENTLVAVIDVIFTYFDVLTCYEKIEGSLGAWNCKETQLRLMCYISL